MPFGDGQEAQMELSIVRPQNRPKRRVLSEYRKLTTDLEANKAEDLRLLAAFFFPFPFPVLFLCTSSLR